MRSPTLSWPPAADEPRLAIIESFALIARPAPAVFDFVTNASLWHHWHPATDSVRGAPPRPLVGGDQVTESIHAGARRFEVTWSVLACEPPALWVIAADSPQGEARLVYELRDNGVLTRFFRTLWYRSRRWPWRLFDRNLTRSVLAKQSELALQNLKKVMEGRQHA